MQFFYLKRDSFNLKSLGSTYVCMYIHTVYNFSGKLKLTMNKVKQLQKLVSHVALRLNWIRES